MKGKNIQCAGLTTSNLSADASNFGSCTVKGNLNAHTLQGMNIKNQQITIPGLGHYDFGIR